MYEPCPECDQDIVNGNDHDRDCYYWGYDAENLWELKQSWDRQAKIDRHREKQWQS